MTDTAILARFGKKEDFQEFQLDERIVKRTVAEFFGCSMNEPIWVFYEKKICAELILEESCFTPEKKGVYFVARVRDLEEYPYSVETYLGGLRKLQRGQEDNAIDSDFERMSKQIRPNTAILAHYGYEHQRFFELPLNESVPKTAVAEIFDGQRTLEGTEAFWIFYQQDLCTSLKSANDSFTPTENNIYLVARAKDLRDYPHSVEAYKSGVRVLEPPKEFPYFATFIGNRLIDTVLRKMATAPWTETAVSCKRLRDIAHKQVLTGGGRLKAVSIAVNFIDAGGTFVHLRKEPKRKAGRERDAKSMLIMKNQCAFQYTLLQRSFDPGLEKRITRSEFKQLLKTHCFQHLSLDFPCAEFHRLRANQITQVHARQLHFSTQFKVTYSRSYYKALSSILARTPCTELSADDKQFVDDLELPEDIIRRFRFV